MIQAFLFFGFVVFAVKLANVLKKNAPGLKDSLVFQHFLHV